MAIALKGLQSQPKPETRNLAYITVDYNNNHYDWLVYIPIDANIDQFLSDNANKIYAEIAAKEAQWAALNPKTKTVIDIDTGTEKIVDVQKEEIVRPDFLDYYASRRLAYPPIEDQLDALWKGPGSVEYQNMVNKILEVKNTYPKN